MIARMVVHTLTEALDRPVNKPLRETAARLAPSVGRDVLLARVGLDRSVSAGFT